MKEKLLFECVECGYQSPKMYGRCPQCQNWNSMIEVLPVENEPQKGRVALPPVPMSDIDSQEIKRVLTGIAEFDIVLGGGIVPNSVIMIGGEPGVGKSTLLLEVAGVLSEKNRKILYYSGEESPTQIKLRADRIGCDFKNIHLQTMATLEDLKSSIAEIKPHFLIIDSIQTIHSKHTSKMAGSVSSLRYLTSEIIQLAKVNQITVFLIGHITKEGQLAGPKTLEHMVDVVLYFQGEIQTDIRILRAEKNRYGPINEVGIFQMTAEGLTSVNDPSQVFIHHRRSTDAGIAIFPAISGLRSILIEVQTLVAESPFVGNPRRISIGFDHYRLSMLISIIEKKLKLPFYKSDVFTNMTGGIFIRETAADMAVCAALISSYKNIIIKPNAIFLGELGLTGEIRPVSFLETRIKEAMRQGYTIFYLPSTQSSLKNFSNISVISIDNIYGLINHLKSKE